MRPEWGKKIVCAECKNIFYDMCQSDITCTKCGNKFKSNVLTKISKSDKKTKKFAYTNNNELERFAQKGLGDVERRSGSKFCNSVRKMAIGFIDHDNSLGIGEFYDDAIGDSGLVMEDD